MRWCLLAVVLVACSSPVSAPPQGDAGADAPEAGPVDAAPDTSDPGPTPEQWAVCPDNIRDLGYVVRSCSYVSGAFGLEHPARVASAEPTWIADDRNGNRAITIEEWVVSYVQRHPEASVLAGCRLAQLPPPCRCADCSGQAFDITACAGFENGRMYLQEQLNIIGALVARTGRCPRLQ